MGDVVRFAAAKYRAGTPYKCIVVENVVEVVQWRKYSSWLTSMTTLDIPDLKEPIYEYQILYWNTQFFGVPQSRDRVYLVFWLRELPAPDFDFHPVAFCGFCQRETGAVQSWKNGGKWGRYQDQYTYRCPQCNREVFPPVVPASSVLNLDHPGCAIGERHAFKLRELKPKTIKKIQTGIERLNGQPFLLGYYEKPLFRRLDEPVGTITTMDRWALVTPGTAFEACRFRMLSPHEVKLCMGFSADYQLEGTAKDQVWMLGNAVCPPIMREILKRCRVAIVLDEMQEVA